MYRHSLESGESRNVVMASYDIGLSAVDDVRKQKAHFTVVMAASDSVKGLVEPQTL